MPYKFKKQVLEAMIVSSLLYACESWLTDNVKEVEKMYVGALKSLLGVRDTTRTDTVLIETGLPSIGERIRKRTAKFAKKELLDELRDETPLKKIFRICEVKRSRGYRYICSQMIPVEAQTIRATPSQSFLNERGSKAQTYRSMNPNLKVHAVYTSNDYINERARVTFTRLRLSSHSLKVETGRWSRINREDRLCECGESIEDEEHVLLQCLKTEFAREKFQINRNEYPSISVLMDTLELSVLVPFVDCCVRVFK